jgi:hypothetical protein
MTPLHKRNCGPCTACCVSLKIKVPELRKKADEPCRHLTGKGCGIYETRPAVCRQFLCGWRLFEELDDSWRPDLSGMLIMRKAPSEMPPAWRSAPYGVHLIVTGGEAAVRRPPFAAYVARQIARGIPVYLSAPAPSTLVNNHVDAVLLGDPAALRERLVWLYSLLRAARWECGLWRMIAPLYRLQMDVQRRRFT